VSRAGTARGTLDVMSADLLDLTVDDSLRHQLSAMEARLRTVLHDTDHRMLTDRATHLIEAGGKRLRPLLALLGAQFGAGFDTLDESVVVDAAVITELIHAATLHHDDVMDAAPVRHGVATASSLWGNNLAVLLGDLLLARAAELGAELGARLGGDRGVEALRLQAATLARLVRGQLLETQPPDGDAMAHCVEVMADKTGSLIAMALELGAVVAGAPEEHRAALARCGEALGIAFQLGDDVIDITTPAAESGKTPGTDLREGVMTVPVLHALRGTDLGAGRLRALLATGAVTDPDRHAEALTLLRRSAGVELARVDVHRYAERARRELAALPPSPARATLDELCDYVTTRTV
jgi:geranylgeranyl pyrophosphate synthase